MTPAEENMFRFQLSVITAAINRKEECSVAIQQLIKDVNDMLEKRENRKVG